MNKEHNFIPDWIKGSVRWLKKQTPAFLLKLSIMTIVLLLFPKWISKAFGIGPIPDTWAWCMISFVILCIIFWASKLIDDFKSIKSCIDNIGERLKALDSIENINLDFSGARKDSELFRKAQAIVEESIRLWNETHDSNLSGIRDSYHAKDLSGSLEYSLEYEEWMIKRWDMPERNPTCRRINQSESDIYSYVENVEEDMNTKIDNIEKYGTSGGSDNYDD
jgi:hypothetical protein